MIRGACGSVGRVERVGGGKRRGRFEHDEAKNERAIQGTYDTRISISTSFESRKGRNVH